MLNFHDRPRAAALLLISLQACSASPDGVAAAPAPDTTAAPAPTSSTAECAAGSSKACSCPDGAAAAQTCSNGYWLPCACLPSPGSADSAQDCKPGRYEGDFSGLYSSGYTFVGVPIPVFGLDAEGPGLAFTLNAEQSDGISEFPTFSISDGYVRGTADGAFPFEGALTGTLDCRTKTFNGTLSGGYCVGPCAGVNEAKFSGPVTGKYDGTSFSFGEGAWKLVEEGEGDPLGFDFGGDGEWNAKWVGEGSVDVDSGVAVGP